MLHNLSEQLNCGPCSQLGYLDIHSFTYQASQAHREQLFVSAHQCIPLIPLSRGGKSAGCLREVIELFPSIASLRRKLGVGKKCLENAEVHPGNTCNIVDKET